VAPFDGAHDDKLLHCFFAWFGIDNEVVRVKMRVVCCTAIYAARARGAGAEAGADL
jgi:hypothetical protein